jgi:hypothetical protein
VETVPAGRFAVAQHGPGRGQRSVTPARRLTIKQAVTNHAVLLVLAPPQAKPVAALAHGTRGVTIKPAGMRGQALQRLCLPLNGDDHKFNPLLLFQCTRTKTKPPARCASEGLVGNWRCR